jgi:hypothetical protein
MADSAPLRRRHKGEDPFADKAVIAFIVVTTIIIVAALFVLRSHLDDEVVSVSVRTVTTAPSVDITTIAPVPSPSATPVVGGGTHVDLVAAARLVKPLEDITKGDRVLYRGQVCRWLSWDLNINTSTIKCATGDAFQIQTGRLTPVEQASRSKVGHR